MEQQRMMKTKDLNTFLIENVSWCVGSSFTGR